MSPIVEDERKWASSSAGLAEQSHTARLVGTRGFAREALANANDA